MVVHRSGEFSVLHTRNLDTLRLLAADILRTVKGTKLVCLQRLCEISGWIQNCINIRVVPLQISELPAIADFTGSTDPLNR